MDLTSVKASLPSARSAAVGHFVYVSVAQPAPIMKAYVQTRGDCEALIRAKRTQRHHTAAMVCPRTWPLVAYSLVPFYWLFERLPPTRETALRLGLVRLPKMIGALIWAIENPFQGIRIVEVNQIKAVGSRR